MLQFPGQNLEQTEWKLVNCWPQRVDHILVDFISPTWAVSRSGPLAKNFEIKKYNSATSKK